jgi:hypothetical protein
MTETLCREAMLLGMLDRKRRHIACLERRIECLEVYEDSSYVTRSRSD